MKIPMVSIIIPAYNVESYLAEAISSAQAQTIKEVEILIIDDSSSDRTRQVAESFTNDPRVKLLLNSASNRGTSGARNTGLHAATGRYLGFLDGDDIWHREKAECHVEEMEADAQIDLTFSRWATIDEHGAHTGRVTTPPPKRRFQMEDLLKENFVGGSSNVICRARAIQKAGVFDPSLSAAVDLDLWLRISRLRDGNICFVDNVLTFYRLREGQITKDWRRMAQNWEIVLEKVRRDMPERVAGVEREARAKHLRYRSYLAYESGDFAAARKLFWKACSSNSWPLFTDRRTWITAAAVLGSTMPAPLHRKLADGARRLRAQHFGTRQERTS